VTILLGVHLNEGLSWKTHMLAILKKVRINELFIHYVTTWTQWT